MKIPYEYFEDEVKDGFYVDSLMKCCWAAQEEVLNVIDEICRKFHIQYFAEWGTLLGTIRHGGFIPWDDDMDIMMKREDYNRFLQVVKTDLPEGYHVMNYRNDGDYWDVMSRVVNSKAIRFDAKFLDTYHNFPFSTGIDIFPTDYLPTNEGEAEVLKNLIYEVKCVADSYGEGYLSGDELEIQLERLEALCNQKIQRTGDLREHLYDIVVSLYALYHEDESDRIALMPLWCDNSRCSYPKEYYQGNLRMKFDQTSILVPVAYDAILKQKYGDYMEMVRKGGSHDYPYFKKQIEIMEKCDCKLPDFQYENRTVRNKTSTEISVITDDIPGKKQIEVLEKAHNGVLKLLMLKENEMTIKLLTQCQECAISLGTELENTFENCQGVIQLLEEYCESLFGICQLLADGETIDAQSAYLMLREQLVKIQGKIEKEYQPKKKVVFLVDKVSRWKSVAGLYRAAIQDAECKVSVVVVPYYYRRLDGTVLESHNDKDLFPKELEVLDASQLNLSTYHADVIIINSPYDEYNYFMSIHPEFYTSKLVNQTKLLVYVPWFTITELTREDERGWNSMQHFVTMPGVVNADKVLVQSEQMRNTYIDYLTDWAGEETRTEWEQKIACLDSQYVEIEDVKEKAFQKLPDIWKTRLLKKDGTHKKMVLYSVGSSGFIEYGMKAAEKIEYVLRTFKENQENIVLTWYPDKMIETALHFEHPELWRTYQGLVRRFQQENWGIYADGIEEQIIVDACHAYYGDSCKLSQAVAIAKKPVMLQNVMITE